MIRLPEQILRFALAGVAGLLVDMAVLYLALRAGLDPYGGRLLSFLAAVFATWQINRRYTFATAADAAPATSLWRQWWHYLGAMAVGGLLNYALYSLLIALGPKRPLFPLAAVACGSLAGMTLNFLSAKLLVFRQHAAAAAPPPHLRLWDWLDQPRSAARLCWLVPLGFGLLSLALGQDANWDLLNYHRYNPYALLGGRIGVDLAPGQWQSYFNPTLDLFYHGLNSALPAPLTGFIMGALHGLNFVLVLAIAHILLGPGTTRVPLLLALAGCLGPGFLSQIGNSMGDNMTSLFVLAALWRVLARWEAPSLPALGIAGLLAGLGAGLKLTNAVYALALCGALLALALPFRQRVRASFVFGLAVLAGIALSAGYWYWTMWTVFGNPLFPQFNQLFHAPLATPIGIGDGGWLPRGLAEKLLWPFIFTLDPKRVIELPIRQLIWPVLYLLALVLPLRRAAVPAGPLRGFLLFFALAYLVWLNLFGIYRYLVPLELLAPLAVFMLARLVLPGRAVTPLALGVVAICAVTVLPFHSWGHTGWHRQAYHAQAPRIPAPRESMVITVTGDPPLGWLVPFFPPDLVFVSLGAGFPESDAYVARVRAMMDARRGPLYAMLPAPTPYRHTSTDFIARAEQEHIRVVASARAVLQRYAMDFDPATCRRHLAYLGRDARAYEMCLIQRR